MLLLLHTSLLTVNLHQRNELKQQIEAKYGGASSGGPDYYPVYALPGHTGHHGYQEIPAHVHNTPNNNKHANIRQENLELSSLINNDIFCAAFRVQVSEDQVSCTTRIVQKLPSFILINSTATAQLATWIKSTCTLDT